MREDHALVGGPKGRLTEALAGRTPGPRATKLGNCCLGTGELGNFCLGHSANLTGGFCDRASSLTGLLAGYKKVIVNNSCKTLHCLGMNYNVICLVSGFAVAAALVFGAVTLPFGPRETQSSPASLNKFQIAQRQTVLVKTPTGSGSAVMIQRHNALGQPRWFAWTAGHVVRNFPTVEIQVIFRTEGRKAGLATYQAKVLKVDFLVDAAFLFVDAPADAFLSAEFATDVPSTPGDPVFAVGNFRGASFDSSVSTGVISQVGIKPTMPGWPWPISDQTTVPVYPGSSGGPMFNADGKVLGLVVGGLDSTLNVFVPVRALTAWAKAGNFLWAIRGDACPSDTVGKFFEEVKVVVPEPAVEEPSKSKPATPKKKIYVGRGFHN